MDKSIKVGPLTYKVIEVPEEMFGEGVMGHESFSTGIISILMTLRPAFKMESLWHELMHIVTEQHNISLNEAQIDALATGVMGIVLDNPEIMGMTVPSEEEGYYIQF
jgi:hypothetical protein